MSTLINNEAAALISYCHPGFHVLIEHQHPWLSTCTRMPSEQIALREAKRRSGSWPTELWLDGERVWPEPDPDESAPGATIED